MLEFEITVTFDINPGTGVAVTRAFFDTRNWADQVAQMLEAYRKDGIIKQFHVTLIGENVVHSPNEVVANLLRQVARDKANLIPS